MIPEALLFKRINPGICRKQRPAKYYAAPASPPNDESHMTDEVP
jgi:hypothetical protein